MMVRNRARRRFAIPKAGAAAVEFAIIAPILFLMLLGMMELGRGFMVKQSLANASRAACRGAIIDGATQQSVLALTTRSLAGTGISGYSVTTSPAVLSTASSADPITVTIDVSYADVSWLPSPQFLNGVMLQGTCSMPHE